MRHIVSKSVYNIIVLFLAASCATAPVLFERGVTVAVWNFDDYSPSAFAQPGLGALLSGQVIDTMQQRTELTIVERDKLLHIIEELGFGTTWLIDESTRLRLGRIVGARFMIFGGYQVISNTMRLDLRLVEVKTSRVLKAVHKSTSTENLSGWLKNAREATIELLQS